MDNWYYLEDGRSCGPVSFETLQMRARQHHLTPRDLVWTEGMADWLPAGNLDRLVWPDAGFASVSPPVFVEGMHRQTAFGQPPAIPNYLPWAIIATIFCCLPAGVVSIIYSAKAMEAKNAGNYPGAIKAAGTARLWVFLSVVLTVASWLVMLVFGLLASLG